MTGKGRLYLLASVSAIVSLIIVGMSLQVLYRSALEQQQNRLLDLVRSQAAIYKVLAEASAEAAPILEQMLPGFDPYQSTLRLIKEAHSSTSGLGETGEFTLAIRDRSQIVFLSNHRYDDSDVPPPVPFASNLAEPMRRALSGRSGVMVGLDYRGEEVVAAHQPIEPFGIGIVAKVDLVEIRRPYVHAGLFLAGISLILIFAGAGFSLRIGHPIIGQLRENEARLRANNTRLEALWRVTSTAGMDAQSVSETILAAAVKMTDSECGFHGTVEQDEKSLKITSWYGGGLSDCTVRQESKVLPIAEAGLWSEAIRQRQPLIVNNYAHRHPAKHGLPEGHVILTRMMVVPLIVEGHITQVAAVANREAEYTPQDAERIAAFLSSMQNIIAGHQAEERIAFLSQVTEQVGDSIMTVDLNFRITYVNRAFLDLFHYAKDDVLGRQADYILAGDDAAETHEQIVRVVSEGDIWRGETLGQRKNGTNFPCELTVYPIMDRQGDIISYAGSQRDISERKMAEEALRKSEEGYRRLFQESNDAIFVHNFSRVILDANDRACQMLGYSREQLLRMKSEDTFPEAELKHAGQALMKLVDTGSVSFETKLRRADGSELDVNVSSGVVDPKAGLVQVVVRDISETKRLRALESRAERLETAGTIAGQVAHDFNNLLSPLIAYPALMREDLPEDHSALPLLSQIEQAARKMADINNDLLALGRRGHYDQVPLNLNDVVQQSLSELEPFPPELIRDVNLGVGLMNCLGNSAQIYRMICNLLNNARDAMQDKGKLTVRTENCYIDRDSVDYTRVPRGEYVKLTVSDTGCGISEDLVEKIFDPFVTSKRADKKRGSGLGMSVVDAVVKDHHGLIDLRTKVDEGTTFYIYLPITRNAVERTDEDNLLGGTESILVVDDDEVQREVSVLLLMSLGYKVTAVASGEQAVDFLRNTPQDLVILDMVMPDGIDGAETYRRILDLGRQQKAIILSGYSESDRVQEAQRLGAGEFVRKPITKRVVAAAVRHELDRAPEPVTA